MLGGVVDLCCVGYFCLHVFPEKVTQTALGKHPRSQCRKTCTKFPGSNSFEFMGQKHQFSQLYGLVSCNPLVEQKQEVAPSTLLLPCEMLAFCPGNPQSTIETVFWESRLLYPVDSKSSLLPLLVKGAFF